MSDRLIGALLFVLAVVYGVVGRNYESAFTSDPLGPSAFPQLLAVALGVTALVLLFRPGPGVDWARGIALVGEVVAVCVRRYGGTNLGTGGLARAYAGGVQEGLEGLPTEERIVRVGRRVTVGYPHVDELRRLLDELEAVVTDEAYGVDVRYAVDVPVTRTKELERRVADLTAGEGRVGEG